MGRGGYHERLRIGGSCKTAKKAAPGSIAAHPFGKLRAGSSKIAKGGAASVGVVHGWAILPRYEVNESNEDFSALA